MLDRSPALLPTRRAFLSTLAATATAGVLARAQSAARRRDEPAGGGFDGQRSFRESLARFANPGRGFYAQRRSDRMDRLDGLRAQGISLLLVTFDLRDFKDRPIAAEKLQELATACAIARRGGFKIVFRAAYGFTQNDYRADPFELDRIVGHVRQIAAVLTAEADVIFAIQAGMLGPWGEWHGSNHGNPPSLASRRAVLFAWLDATPPAITVHVRRPMFIRDIFADEPGGSELTQATAFSGSRLARTGWHNDAFLALPTDLGTYAERGWSRERELDWCRRHGRFTPFGGETVHRDPLMPIAAMIAEMEALHATYLNIGYHPRVVQFWREATHLGENAFDHIARRLGARLVAGRLAYGRELRGAAECRFELTLRNTGFAALHQPRVVEAALFPAGSSAPVSVAALADADPRWWSPEAGSITLRGAVPVPAALRGRGCALGLRLRDPAAALREDGRYAFRFANEDVRFDAASGWHVLADDLRVGVA